MSFWPRWSENKPFALVLIILLAYLGVLTLMKANFLFEQTVRLDRPEPREFTIAVEGEAEMKSTPDLATILMTVETKGDAVAGVQEENTTTMNKLIGEVKKLGVKDEDLQTASYNVRENKEGDGNAQRYVSFGWIVSQTLTVKMRDLAKVPSVVAIAGGNGVTDLNGPNFTIDDPTSLRDEARRRAIAQAHTKASELADALGGKLVRVIAFTENGNSKPPMPYYYAKSAEMGMGGGSPEPVTLPGSEEVNMRVSVTYLLE